MKEEWKSVPGYDGYYEISNMGKVRSYKKGNGRWGRAEKPHILKPRVHTNGYLRVSLCSDGVANDARIHRLVARVFIPNLEGKRCVNHRDGNKENNVVSNLEWCTYSENIQHAYNAGLKEPPNNTGEKNPFSKLSSKDVLKIRDLHGDLSGSELAEMFGISNTQISAIVNRKSWTHI